MKLAWRRLAAAALLLTVLAGGLWLAQRAASPAFVAGALSRVAGLPVTIGEVRIVPGLSLRLEFSDVRVGPHGHEPVFRAPRMTGWLGWPRLLTGRAVPLRWHVDEPHIVIGDGASGRATELPLDSIPPVNLTVSGASVEFRRDGVTALRLEQIDADARRARFGFGIRGHISGRLQPGDAEGTPFAGTFEAGGGGVSFDGEIEAIDLAALPGMDAESMELEDRPSGRASGHVRLSYREGSGPDGVATAHWAGGVDLAVENFHLLPPDFGGPIEPADMRVAIAFDWADDELRLEPQPLQLDDLGIRGELVIGLGDGGRVRGSLEVADFEPGKNDGGRLQLFRLIGLQHDSWLAADARSEGGVVEEIRFDLDLPADGVGDAFAFRRRLAPEELRIRGRIRDGVYRPRVGSTPIEDIAADIEIAGDVLLLRDLELSTDGKPFPHTDIRIDGMRRLVRLPERESKTPRDPGPTPGLGPALDALGSGDPDADRPDTVLSLTDTQLALPAFVFPIRDASATLRFPGGDLRVENGKGVVGGAPAHFTASWDRGSDALAIDLVYLDGNAPADRATPPGVAAGSPWLDAVVASPTLHFGDWRVDEARFRLQAHGTRVGISDVSGSLVGGALSGRGEVSLDETDGAPYELDLELRDGDAAALHDVIGMPGGTLTGVLSARGTIGGRLAEDLTFLTDADCEFFVELRDGSFANLPATVLLARLSSPLGWRGLFGRPLPFDRASASLLLDDGVLRLGEQGFSLEGPELRMSATGEIDLASPDLETDMLIGLLFLQTVDRVVGAVPVVGDWVLGKDRNLVALYFQLEGPWRAPQGRYVPPRAAGMAGNVIGGGASFLRDLLLRGLPGGGARAATAPPGPEPSGDTGGQVDTSGPADESGQGDANDERAQ